MIVLKFAQEINGDSNVPKHENWITVDTLQFGVGRAISTSGGGVDRKPSAPSWSEISLTKSMDIASVELMMQATCGKSLGTAEIHFLRTGDDDLETYLIYELENAMLSSYSVSSAGDDPVESISLCFTQIKMDYLRFKDGTAGGSVGMKGWNLQTNKKV